MGQLFILPVNLLNNMKFKRIMPKTGDQRTRRIFLWLPKTSCYYDKSANIVKETRWLEFAYILEYYSTYDGWEMQRFTDKDQDKKI